MPPDLARIADRIVASCSPQLADVLGHQHDQARVAAATIRDQIADTGPIDDPQLLGAYDLLHSFLTYGRAF